MKFVWYFLLGLIFVACSPIEKTGEKGSPVNVVGTQSYEIRQKISLANTGEYKPEKQNLWVALIHDLPPYQEVTYTEISPNHYTLLTDEYGNQYAEFDLSDHPPGTSLNVEILYKVSVHEIDYDLSSCAGSLPGEFTQPELHIESANPQIISLAENLSKGKKSVCEQVRAFYDYAGDNLLYTYNRQDWGA